MVADLLPRVERSHLWFSENVELLFCAQIAPSCHRVEGGPPVEHLPFNVEGGAPGLELPDVGAQFGLAFLLWVGKGALVARISTLPRGSRDPDVFCIFCIFCIVCIFRLIHSFFNKFVT